MLDILYCEWLKLKHSRILAIGFFGSLICPVLTLASCYVRNGMLYPERVTSLFEIYDNAMEFILLLFGPMIMALVAVFLIVREYTEKTWKTIFVVPVSRIRILCGKFLILFFLMVAFLILSWMEIFLLAVLCSFLFEISGVTIAAAFFFLVRMMKWGILLYPTITPFVYLAFRTKGGMVPFLSIAGVSLVNVVLSNTPVANFYPWLLPHWLMSVSLGRMESDRGRIGMGVFILGMVFFIGVFGSMWRIWREDVN